MNNYEEIMNSAKYNIAIQIDRAYQQGYEDGKKVSCDCKDNMESEYNRGLNDAWEVARKIAKLGSDEQKRLFGCFGIYFISHEVSASEAIAKIKEYEEQQKQDTKIKVWDEVYSEMNDLRFIVTRIITSKHMDNTVKRYEGICTDGACYDNLPEDICKTGRTFPQIAEVLEKMRGEKE